MSTDLTHVANTGTQDLTGLTTLIRIKPSNLTLIQPMTQNPRNARLGQYLDELTGEAYNSITVVPLRVSRSRVLFPPGNSFGEDPLCRSNDGVFPSPFAIAPQSETCATCNESRWVDNKKPPCRESWNLLVIVKETGLPRYVSFSGVGIKVLKSALEAIKQNIVVSAVPRDLYSYYFTLSVDVQRKTTVYAMPRIENITPVENPSEFGPLFQEYVLNRVNDAETAAEDVDGLVDSITNPVSGI